MENLKPKSEVLEIAKQYGYSSLFALKSSEDIAQLVDNACKLRDFSGMTLALGLVQNRMAVDIADTEYRLQELRQQLEDLKKS